MTSGWRWRSSKSPRILDGGQNVVDLDPLAASAVQYILHRRLPNKLKRTPSPLDCGNIPIRLESITLLMCNPDRRLSILSVTTSFRPTRSGQNRQRILSVPPLKPFQPQTSMVCVFFYKVSLFPFNHSLLLSFTCFYRTSSIIVQTNTVVSLQSRP